MKWIDARTNPPKKQGNYLCAMKGGYHDICCYAFSLEKVDKYDFGGERRRGWYQYDSEWGHCERTDVTHYMPLPELPNRKDGADNE